MPIVSIIMPSFNSERFIKKSLISIISQSFKNWELIITDDASIDSTVEIIKEIQQKDSRIKLVELTKNSGAGVARNNSISKAKGRYIAFCDSDDQWLPQKLEVQLEFMKTNNLAFTYSSYFIQDENGMNLGQVTAPVKISYKEILRNNYIGCLTAIYDTKLLGKVFMPEIRKRQDWMMWIKIIEKLKVVKGLENPLAIYTKRETSISSNKIELLKHNWLVYHEGLNYSKVFSAILMIRFLFYYFKNKVKI